MKNKEKVHNEENLAIRNFNFLKDMIFEMVNDIKLPVNDIETNDSKSTITITLSGGQRFLIKCHQLNIN